MTDNQSERIKLESGMDRLGMTVPSDLVNKLLTFMSLLKEWSGTYNLVAPRERDFLLTRHLLDSLSIANWLQEGSLLDVGSGAGLPGLPLAIIDPERDVTLVDSAGKKIRFIRHVGRELKLDNIYPVHERIEEMKQTGDYANITSRAFSSLRDFVMAVRPFAGESTRLLAMKGVFPHKELEELPDWVNVQSVESLTVPYLHAERHLVLMSVPNQDGS